MVLRKSFYIRWSAGRSPRVHEVNPGRDPSASKREVHQINKKNEILGTFRFSTSGICFSDNFF